jgi:hypothetical protein
MITLDTEPKTDRSERTVVTASSVMRRIVASYHTEHADASFDVGHWDGVTDPKRSAYSWIGGPVSRSIANSRRDSWTRFCRSTDREAGIGLVITAGHSGAAPRRLTPLSGSSPVDLAGGPGGSTDTTVA